MSQHDAPPCGGVSRDAFEGVGLIVFVATETFQSIIMGDRDAIFGQGYSTVRHGLEYIKRCYINTWQWLVQLVFAYLPDEKPM